MFRRTLYTSGTWSKYVTFIGDNTFEKKYPFAKKSQKINLECQTDCDTTYYKKIIPIYLK